MPMTRAQLRSEIKDLGHNYGTTGWDTRLDRFLNQGARDVILSEDWPQRRTTTVLSTGTSGATLSLPGTIRQVWLPDADGGMVLEPIDVTALREDYPGQSNLLGVPVYYYVERTSNTSWTIKTWPERSGQTINVDYFQRACWLNVATPVLEAGAGTTGHDSYTLVGDETFEDAVILATRLRVLGDADELDLAEALEVQLQREIARLKDNELTINGDEPESIKQTRVWY
jgi:hypothetical protein